MTANVPTPDARQREAICCWIADLEAMPGVAEVLGWQVIDGNEFLEAGERRPEGLYVEFRFRRRGEDPELCHRLRVGPIAPGGTDGEDAEGARPRPSGCGTEGPGWGVAASDGFDRVAGDERPDRGLRARDGGLRRDDRPRSGGPPAAPSGRWADTEGGPDRADLTSRGEQS